MMLYFLKLFTIIAFLLSGKELEARVFRMNDETFATYFGASYGPSVLKQTHFSGTSGLGVVIDKSVTANYSGEFGILFRGSKVGLRLGLETIKPLTLAKATGSDANGVKLYDFESNISALVPKVTLEINLKGADTWRTFLALGAGTATATYKNSYTLTAEGQTTFPGIANFSEEGSSTALLYDGALGFETLVSDTTTILLGLGYRKLDITDYKYKTAVTSFDGSHAAGDSVLNADGTNKKSSYTGAYASLFFRFYLGK